MNKTGFKELQKTEAACRLQLYPNIDSAQVSCIFRTAHQDQEDEEVRIRRMKRYRRGQDQEDEEVWMRSLATKC